MTDDPRDATWIEADAEPRMHDSWPRIAVGALLVLGVTLAAVAALAHEAPSGWRYDGACCNAVQQHGDGRVTGDCAPIPEAAVEEVRGGYIVRLAPGDHPRISEAREYRFDWPADAGGFERIRPSPDGRWHACVTDHARYCLYFVPGGV